MGFIRWLFQDFLPRKPSSTPRQVNHRVRPAKAAVVFIHGFSGDTASTWSGMLTALLSDTRTVSWDVIGLGFPSSLRIDVPNVWAADPDLTTVARSLNTALSLPPLQDYQALTIVAHSMGGLVAQRAILDDANVMARVRHLLIFGTPSGGLPKARLVSRLKRQFRDMSPKSEFIQHLRRDWKGQLGTPKPFNFVAIAGDRDEFVPASSSLVPFELNEIAVVPGNHLEIVKPDNASHLSVVILVDALLGSRRALPPVDGAGLAVELGQFQHAIDTLLPHVSRLDDNGIVRLALALESAKRGDEALQVLELHHHGGSSSTEAMGTLAGRLKRRWLTSRTAYDYDRALELYEAGLAEAEMVRDYDQAFYHAINIAFLWLMKLPPYSSVTQSCRDMAQRAMNYCAECRVSHWRLATEGEALLILNSVEEAIRHYAEAINRTNSQREIDSMYAQAFRVAERIYGEDGIKKIEEAFGLRR